MDYEVFEPDPNDEYYDQMCAAAYAFMFCERSGCHVDPDVCDPEPVGFAAAG